MSNTTINEYAKPCSNCYDYYKDSSDCLSLLTQTINNIFDTFFYQFENKGINKNKLIENLIKHSLTKGLCADIHPIAQAFSVLHNSFVYYKSVKNELMVNFIDQALMESNLMYFEGGFDNINDLSDRDRNFIEYIIEKSL